MDMIDKMINSAKKSSNPLRAIKAFCARCICGINAKKECIEPQCPLYDFRYGKNPRRKPTPYTQQRQENLEAGKVDAPAR